MATLAELDERIAKCQKILSDDPNSQIFAALAEALRKKGEFDKAFRICQTGLRVHPSYGSAHLVMAKINLDRGQYDWAEIEANKAAEIDGRTRAVELLLAEIYIYKGEFRSAIALLKRLHEADPENSQIKKLLEIARRLPEEQRALAESQRVEQVSAAVQQDEPADKQESEVCLDADSIVFAAGAVPGVDGSLFVQPDGEVAHASWDLESDHAQAAREINGVLGLIRHELPGDFGAPSSVLLETAGHTFYVVPVHNGAFLFVTDDPAKLGALKMKLEGLLVKYR